MVWKIFIHSSLIKTEFDGLHNHQEITAPTFTHRGTWSVDDGALYRNHRPMPNLSSQRRDPTLLAFGDALRRIRQAKGISQERLALLATVDRSYVGRVERGDNNVALLTLAKLASALEMSVASLMEQAGI